MNEPAATRVCLATAAMLLCVAGAPAAVSLVNPGFEADAFGIWPGYAADNGAITGWEVSPVGTGINPVTGGASPFADNGAIPEGRQVCLIQNAGWIRQTVTGFTPGQRYILTLRCNARSVPPYAMPALRASLGATVLGQASVASVHSTNAYFLAAWEYTAAVSAAVLTLENTNGAADNTVLLDDVRIVEADGYQGWVMAPLIGDADSRLEQAAHYTHALDSAGTAVGRSANGVPFERPAAPGTNGVAIGSNWRLTGVPNGVGNAPPAGVAGGIQTLLQDFWYGGNPETATLSGLLPGAPHVATFFSRGWGPVGGRVTFLTADDGTANRLSPAIAYDQNGAGDGNGLLLEYRYRAPTGGVIRFTFTPRDAVSTWHHYALANRRVLAADGLLFADSFNSATQEGDINSNRTARQTGSLAPLTYSQGGPAHGHQVGDATTHHPGVLEVLQAGWVGVDHNFNGAESEGGIAVSFDLDPNWTANPEWGAICVGGDADFGNGWVNRAGRHFGILFRASGTVQAFDGGTVVSPDPEPVWGGTAGVLRHIELRLTDATDANPFDGSGETRIAVFVDGGASPVFEFVKPGGYPNNYINVQGDDWRAEFDNLAIRQLPQPVAVGTLLIVR